MRSPAKPTLIVVAALFAVLACLVWVGTAKAADPGYFLIDGGRVQKADLPAGVEVVRFGVGPAEAGPAGHALAISTLARRRLGPAISVTLLEALPAADYGARDRQVAAAARYASAHGARVVNVSMGKPVAQPLTCQAIRSAPQTLFVIGAGNDGRDLGSYGFWPAVCKAPNTLVVGMTDDAGQIRPESNYGGPVGIYMPATSTSEATVLASTMVARYAAHHPKASAKALRYTARSR